MMNTVILVLVIVAVMVPIALAWENRRSAKIVRRWAEQNGFAIIESDFRALKRGPFWATTWNYQAVRRVAVIPPSARNCTIARLDSVYLID